MKHGGDEEAEEGKIATNAEIAKESKFKSLIALSGLQFGFFGTVGDLGNSRYFFTIAAFRFLKKFLGERTILSQCPASSTASLDGNRPNLRSDVLYPHL